MAIPKTVTWPIAVTLPGVDAKGAPVQLVLKFGADGKATVSDVVVGGNPMPPPSATP